MLKHLARPIGFVFSTLLLTTGCSDTPVPTAAPAEVDVTVPWSANLTDVGFVNPEPMTCAAGFTASSQNDGSGTFGYLGAGTYTARWCARTVALVGTEGSGEVGRLGYFNITLATGEKINGEITGGQALQSTICAHLAEVHAEVTFTGGTGRFAGRTGVGTVQGTQVGSACPNLGVVRTLSVTLRSVFFNKL